MLGDLARGRLCLEADVPAPLLPPRVPLVPSEQLPASDSERSSASNSLRGRSQRGRRFALRRVLARPKTHCRARGAVSWRNTCCRGAGDDGGQEADRQGRHCPDRRGFDGIHRRGNRRVHPVVGERTKAS